MGKTNSKVETGFDLYPPLQGHEFRSWSECFTQIKNYYRYDPRVTVDAFDNIVFQVNDYPQLHKDGAFFRSLCSKDPQMKPYISQVANILEKTFGPRIVRWKIPLTCKNRKAAIGTYHQWEISFQNHIVVALNQKKLQPLTPTVTSTKLGVLYEEENDGNASLFVEC